MINVITNMTNHDTGRYSDTMRRGMPMRMNLFQMGILKIYSKNLFSLQILNQPT